MRGALHAFKSIAAIGSCAALCFSCADQVLGPPGPPEGEVWLSRDAMQKGRVRLAEVKEREIPQAVVAPGRIAFDDARVTHVYSPVTGRVTRLLAKLGAHVKKGTPLVAIASPDVATALSDFNKARADLTAARHEHDRQQELWKIHAGSQRDLEMAVDNFHKAQAEEQRAQQKVRLLRAGKVDAVTQEYTLTSFIEGDVIARMVNPGVEVQGQYSGGTAVELFTIGNIERVWAYADVREADLPSVHEGDRVAVKVVARPEETFHGKVEWLAASLDPALRTARVRVSLDNKGKHLKPEMFATVAIEQQPKKMLAVPRKAVTRINEQTFVHVRRGTRPDGKDVFQRRRVHVANEHAHKLQMKAAVSEVFLPQTAQLEEEYVAIDEGLKGGETVVVEGAVSRDQPNDEAWVTDEQLKNADIESARVERREVKDALQIGGRLTFDDQRIAHVFSPVTGRVTKVLAQPGQRVKKGVPLATIASPDLGSAFSDMIKAKADLAFAQHEVRRQRELFEAQAGARRDLEIAEDNFAKAKAEYDRAEKKTRHLRSGAVDTLTQDFLLRSPIDGLVVARGAGPGLEVQGQYSNAASAVELFTVGEVDELWLLGDVFEMDLPQLKAGQEITVRVPGYPKGVFKGRIDWISDVLDPVMRTAKVRAVLENPDGILRPEMYQEATIELSQEKLLAVPREALLRLGEQTVVFVASGQNQDGKTVFKRRRVIGNEERPGGVVPILDGLSPGETVVTKGAIFLVGLL